LGSTPRSAARIAAIGEGETGAAIVGGEGESALPVRCGRGATGVSVEDRGRHSRRVVFRVAAGRLPQQGAPLPVVTVSGAPAWDPHPPRPTRKARPAFRWKTGDAILGGSSSAGRPGACPNRVPRYLS